MDDDLEREPRTEMDDDPNTDPASAAVTTWIKITVAGEPRWFRAWS